MRFSTIIFDMDGLMVDSEPIHHAAVNEVLAPFGVSIDEQENLSYVGVPDRATFQAIVVRHRIAADPLVLRDRKRRAYLRLIDSGVAPMPGLRALLDELAAQGRRLAVASSSPPSEIDLIVGQLALRDRFVGLFSAEEVARGKPFPDLPLHAAARLGTEPRECLVLEDAPAGVAAAKSAGMSCFAIPNRVTARGDFSRADRLLGSLDEVMGALQTIES